MLENVEKCEKLCEKSVDMGQNLRYNGGSLSKSTFRPLQKRKGKRGNLLRSLVRFQSMSLRLSGLTIWN